MIYALSTIPAFSLLFRMWNKYSKPYDDTEYERRVNTAFGIPICLFSAIIWPVVLLCLVCYVPVHRWIQRGKDV